MIRFYCAVLQQDWTRWIMGTAKNIAYLARYGKQQIGPLEHWPISKILLYTRLTSEIVSEENKAAKGKK